MQYNHFQQRQRMSWLFIFQEFGFHPKRKRKIGLIYALHNFFPIAHLKSTENTL